MIRNNHTPLGVKMPLYNEFTWDGLHVKKPRAMEFKKRYLHMPHTTGTRAKFKLRAETVSRDFQEFLCEWRFRRITNGNLDIQNGNIPYGSYAQNKVSGDVVINRYLAVGDYALDVRLRKKDNKDKSQWEQVVRFDVILRDAYLSYMGTIIIVSIIGAILGSAITFLIQFLISLGSNNG